MGMSVAVALAGGSSHPVAVTSHPDEEREARLAALVHAWWRDERPAWTEESWWDATLDEPIRRLLWLAPGPLLISALADLAPGGPCRLPHTEDRMLPGWPTPGHVPGWPCACQVVTAAAWDACASWVAARCAASLVEAAGSDPVSFDIAGDLQQIHDPAREELAHALRSTIPAMSNRIGHARALVAHPQLVTLVESAAISAWAGRLVLDHVTDLDQQDADKVIAEVCARVHRRLATGRRPYHSAEVNRVARAARLRICPESAQQARVRAFSTRRVTVHPTGTGMATLIADLADIDAHRIHRRLTALAAGLQSDAAADGSPDPRTRDQLRADVLTDLLLGTQASEAAPAPDARAEQPVADDTARQANPPNKVTRAEIHVIVSLETLLGLTEDPAEVPGLGPVPPEVARELACDGRWRAWITDATGTVTATGSRSYVPSAALARLIRAREPRCRFPGCHQPATRCDLDHAVPWPHGATTPENLGPLCRRHHNFKTHTPWTLDPDPTPCAQAAGSIGAAPTAPPGWRWRTPAGLTITDGPEPPLEQHREDTLMPMADSSFDIVSKVDHQEVDNALNQAAKEVATRFDFKNTSTTIAWRGEDGIEITSSTEERCKAALDVLKDKLVRRQVSLKVLDAGEPRPSGKETKIQCSLKAGISKEQASKLNKMIRDSGPKGIKSQVMGDELRVSAKSRDDLQAVQQLVREADLDFAVQFVNYR